MNTRLIDALISVSSLSTSAKELAEQVVQEASPELVKQLYAKIYQLQQELADLTAEVVEPEVVSEEEAHALVVALQARLKDAKWETISRFDRTFLRLYPKAVRPIVATVLCNKAVELKAVPLAVWQDIIALGGEIK